MLLSEADLGEVGFDFDLVSENGDNYDNNIYCEDVGDADNKNNNYHDNSDYYQRCWGCRWAPGKSCWKQLRREGDNCVKRLQQSSRTFLSLRTFSSSLWYSSIKVLPSLEYLNAPTDCWKKRYIASWWYQHKAPIDTCSWCDKMTSLQITLSPSSSDPNV